MNANLDSINFSREKDSGREKDSVIFSLDDQTSVIIRRPTLEEQKIGHQANQIFCTATLERKPNPEILEMFECLRNNRMPKGFKSQNLWIKTSQILICMTILMMREILKTVIL